MPDLSGSLDGIGLAPLLGFLASIRAGGQLSIADDSFAGVVFFDDGRVVGSTFGEEAGLAALEAIGLVLSRARFTFADGLAEQHVNLSLEPDELNAHLDRVGRDSARLVAAIPSLAAVPVTAVLDHSEEDQVVVLERGALFLLLRINGRQSVADLARQHGLRSAMERVTQLLELGLIQLESTSDALRPRAPAVRPSAPARYSTQPAQPDAKIAGEAAPVKASRWSQWRRPES